jgi:hypothetical protein
MVKLPFSNGDLSQFNPLYYFVKGFNAWYFKSIISSYYFKSFAIKPPRIGQSDHWDNGLSRVFLFAFLGELLKEPIALITVCASMSYLNNKRNNKLASIRLEMTMASTRLLQLKRLPCLLKTRVIVKVGGTLAPILVLGKLECQYFLYP